MNPERNYNALTIPDNISKIINECFRNERKGNKLARSEARNALEKFLIETDDGSYTLKSRKLEGKSETMHTHHGAVKESFEKFIKPAQLIGKQNVRILDICSGLGYNAGSCIQFLQDENIKIKIDMIDISKETLAAALLITSPLKSHEIIKKAIENKLYNEGFAGLKLQKVEIPGNIDIEIFCNDARYIIKNMRNESYDVVFLDPFSPIKSPELYSLEFFSDLKKRLKIEGMLLTYTSAVPVRSGLIQAGFHVGEAPPFGRKKGGTVASLSPYKIKKPLSVEDERMIALSDAGIPFRDPQLNYSSNEIARRREDERHKIRGETKLASTVKTPIFLGEDVEDKRLKRRVLENLKDLGIEDLKSWKSRFITCPQFYDCICECGLGRLSSSQERVNEMAKRLSITIKDDVKAKV